MKSEQVQRGEVFIGEGRAVLSHARITIDGSGSYDEIAYRAVDVWTVVASHLDPEQGESVFAALNGKVVSRDTDIAVLAAQRLGWI